MQRFASSLYVLAITLWAGALWTVGFMVAPTLFSVLSDKVLAGDLAGRLFFLMGWIGMGCAAYLLLYRVVREGWRAGRSGGFWLIVVMLACVLASHFGIQPLMAGLKAQAWPREVMQSALRDRFATWHGISSVVYVVQSVLAVILVLLPRPGAR